MRIPRLSALLATAAGLLAAGPALAQRGDEIKIEEVNVGLPAGRFAGEREAGTSRAAGVLKRNVWVPAYLRLKMNREYQGGAQLQIISSDADELKTTLFIPLIQNLSDRPVGSIIEPVELGTIPLFRSGERSGEVKFRIYSLPTDGSRPRALSGEFNVRPLQFRDANTYVVCSLGSKLPGFDLPVLDKKQQESGSRTALRGGRVATAAFTNVREMPDQWFGYQGVDLVVLGTGSATPEFLGELFGDESSTPFRNRRDALLEWVRRGGRLIVSVGSKSVELSGWKLFQDLLPAPIRLDPPTRAMPSLPLKWRVGGNLGQGDLRAKTPTFPVARLGPNPTRPYRVILSSSENPVVDPNKTDMPVVVQSTYGLGRITMVAFDIDQSPFIEMESRAEFWDFLIREGGSARSALPPTGQQSSPYSYSGFSTDEAEDEFLASLRTHVDTFDGVPVVSFGWVALFIVLYTILIGPVEYLVLRYVFRRLELTWITFPLIVVTVSAAAYFTAYAIKGNDLKINKVDVVDVDLRGGRVYGRSWFTIFSPRIDSYTIGIEPKEGWTVANPDVQPGTLVDWMAGGYGSGGGIVSRGYGYHVSDSPYRVADGLEGVPIQVWSTKAFAASWSGAIDRRRPQDGGTPLLDVDLRHPPGDPDSVIGSFTNNLPLTNLQNPVLMYRGKVYKLPTLNPGQRVEVPAIGQRESGLPLDNDWFSRSAALPNLTTSSSYDYGQEQIRTVSNLSLWGALFHEKAIGSEARPLQNASLRSLDQSWRLTEENRDEVILVARVGTANGQAEAIMSEPAGSSPTRLWLKNLPGGSTAREPVPGTLRQETYIRVFIPIPPATAAK